MKVIFISESKQIRRKPIRSRRACNHDSFLLNSSSASTRSITPQGRSRPSREPEGPEAAICCRSRILVSSHLNDRCTSRPAVRSIHSSRPLPPLDSSQGSVRNRAHCGHWMYRFAYRRLPCKKLKHSTTPRTSGLALCYVA